MRVNIDTSIKKALLLSIVILVGMEVVNADRDILSYSSMEAEYEDLELFVEAMWYKVPAIDIIEAKVTVEEHADNFCFYPEFFLRYPDGDTTEVANIPLEGECLGDVDTVSVKFHIWCHDLGGWSVFVFRDGVFEFIGRTKLDFPVGNWAVIVQDSETGDLVAELPLYVAISKPTNVTDRLSEGELYGDIF